MSGRGAGAGRVLAQQGATPTSITGMMRRFRPEAQLLRSWPLTGGVSARVTAVEICGAHGHAERLVVREYGARDLRAKPDIARREFRVLRALHAAHLPVPQPHYVEAGVLVTGFMDGQPEFGPALGAEDACQVAPSSPVCMPCLPPGSGFCRCWPGP